MSICPNITSPEWETLEASVGKLESYRDWLETGGEIRTPELVLAKLEQRKGYAFNNGGVLDEAMDAQGSPIENKIRSLDRINNFLENIQVPVELADFGSTPALAAANFEKGIIQITDKFADRAEAWNELPEEAAHWWYRLLKEDSPMKKELWDLVKNTQEYTELLGDYADIYTSPDALTEEAIGKVIANLVVKIDNGTALVAERTMWQHILDFIEKVLNLNAIEVLDKNDPFVLSAQRILDSDVSDLLTMDEYKALNGIVNDNLGIEIIGVDPVDEPIVDDISDYVERALGTRFKRKSRFMPKTISRLYTRNVSPLEKKTLTEQQIESLEQRNAYTVRTPDLESFEILQAKFKKQPIALNNPIKVAGVKKADLDIYNKVRELIKEEQQDKPGKKMKSIPVADFVYEVKTYLEANYKLGFGHEKSHLSYRVSSTFEHTTLDTNKQIEHDKISIRFNDTYFNQSSHFSYSPTAWGNLTEYQNGVLLHEIQNDFIEQMNDIKRLNAGEKLFDPAPFKAALNTEFVFGKLVEKVVRNPKLHIGADTYREFKDTIEENLHLTLENLGNRTVGEYFEQQKAIIERQKDALYIGKQMIAHASRAGIKLVPESINLNDPVFSSINAMNKMFMLRKVNAIYESPTVELTDGYASEENEKAFIEKGSILITDEPIDIKEQHTFNGVIRTRIYTNRNYNSNITTNRIEGADNIFKVLKEHPDLKRALIQLYIEKLDKAGYQINKNYTGNLHNMPGQTSDVEQQRARTKYYVEQLVKIPAYNLNYLNSMNTSKTMAKQLAAIRMLQVDLYKKQAVLNKISKFRQFTQEQFVAIAENLKFNVNLLMEGYYTAVKNAETEESTFLDDVSELPFVPGTVTDPFATAEEVANNSAQAYEEVFGEEQYDPKTDMGYFVPLMHHLIQTHIASQASATKKYEELAARREAILNKGWAKKYQLRQLNNSDWIATVDGHDIYDIRKQKDGNFAYKIRGDGSPFITTGHRQISSIKKELQEEDFGAIPSQEIYDEKIKDIEIRMSHIPKIKPLIFSGYELTRLTQGSHRTSKIYAGPEEVAKGLAAKVGPLWVMMSKMPGVKLVYQENLEGFKRVETPQDIYTGMEGIVDPARAVEIMTRDNNLPKISGTGLPGGYIVDLSNYRFTEPVLYSLKRTPKKTVAQDLNESMQMNIQQTEAPGMLSSTSMMSQAMLNDKTDNTIEPETSEHIAALSLAKQMVDRLGVNYQIVTPEEALAITEKAKNPWDGESAFFVGGVVYFVGSHLSTKNVFHEFAHPFVRHIANTNHTLFMRLYKQLSETDEGKAIIAEVAKGYPDLDAIANTDLFKEEVIVRALTSLGMDKLNKLKPESKFAKALNNIMYAIKQMMRKIFGSNVPVSGLSPNTTLEDLADMLATGGKIEIDQTLISQDDIVAYNKERAEFMDDMSKVEEGDLQASINRFYQVLGNHINKLLTIKDYESLREILTDESQAGELQQMKSDLHAYQTAISNMAGKTVQDIEEVRKKSTALVNGLYRLEIVMQKIQEHVADIKEHGESIENLHKAYHYSHLIDHWGEFVKEQNKMMKANNVPRDSPIRALLGRLTTDMENITEDINDIYAVGARDTLYDELLPMHQNIKARYDARIAKLILDGAPQARIDREYKEYHGVTEAEGKRLQELEAMKKQGALSESDAIALSTLQKASVDGVAISPEKIELILKGGMGDANFYNSYLEGYLYNTDPVIGGLASYVKNKLNDITAITQGKVNEFAMDVQPLLEKAGYNALRPGDLGRDTGFEDHVAKRDKKTGEMILRKVWTFLNPFKNYRYDYDTYKEAVDKAQYQYSRTGTEEDKDKMATAVAEQQEWLRNYFHQQYSDEFYEAQKILYRGEGDTIGEQAVFMRGNWSDRLKAKTGGANKETEKLNISDDLDMLWTEYRQMRSRYKPNGTLKKGDEALVAERLREHYEATREFYEWKPRVGAFENALTSYEQELIDSGVSPDNPETRDQYYAQRQVWLDKNTAKSPKQSYFDWIQSKYARMSEIYSKLELSEDEQAKIDEGIINKKIFDLTMLRDDNGEIIATEMTPKARAEVIKLEKDLIKMRESNIQKNGLTGAQNAELTELTRLRQAGDWSAQRATRMSVLFNLMNRRKLSEFENRELETIKAELAGVSQRIATDYYVDELNNWLDILNVTDPALRNIDKISADWILDNGVLSNLLGQRDDFDKWFRDNHIEGKTRDPKTKKVVPQWYRSKMWSASVPVDNTQYETTEIINRDGVKEVINGKPITKYFQRVVKPEFKNERVVGVTVDNKGVWLPKTMAQGAKDNKYENERYFKLEKENPELFEAMEKMKEYHLLNQEGVSRNGRLYLDFPRTRKSSLETYQDKNLLTIYAQRVKDWWKGAKDDAEEGFNYNDQHNLVRMDMFDNEITSVPIHGLYDIDADDVSLDIPTTMMQYMYSAERQKQLIAISPVAEAIKSVVNANALDQEDENGVKSINKFSFHNNQVVRFLKQKGDSVRKKTVNNFIEREFKGQRMAGMGKDTPWLNNAASLLFKRASFGFFALNIPSALKNSYGAKFQGMIEASAGQYMTHWSFQKGNGWSYSTMAELSFSGQLYQQGPMSLNQQIVQVFDPSQGKQEEKIGEGLSRTLLKDAASFDWLYSFRKWVELQATLQIFGGMMYHQKVTQQLPDGTKQDIPYMEAWQVVDGLIQLKDGIDPTWGITYNENGEIQVGDKFNRYKNTVHQVMNNLQGAYAKFDQPEAQRYLAFRFISYLRRYFTTMTMNRFGFSGRWGDPKPRLNPGLGDVQMGFYITFIKLAKDTVSNLGKNLMYMTDVEKQAALRFITEVGLLLATTLAMSLIFGFDPDDDEKYEKLRARSGAIPFPLTSEDPERPFNGWGYLENHMLFLLMNVRGENEQFLPLPGYGLNDYSAMLDLKSIAFGPTVQTYKDIFEDALDILQGNEGAYYKRQVGPYFYQQEEGAKIWAHIGRTFGMTGSALDPAKGIKGFQSVQARAR